MTILDIKKDRAMAAEAVIEDYLVREVRKLGGVAEKDRKSVV